MAYSDEAVQEATGRNWQEWFDFLNDRGAAELDHKGIVGLVAADGGVESSWWQQGVTVEFERSIGRREVGRKADGSYQVGVQKTLPVDSDEAWELITSPEAAKIWLGVDALPSEPGQTVTDADGHTYELRSLRDGEKIRLRRTDAETGDESTVQIALIPGKTGTAVNFHHEGLADADERARKHEHWRDIADKILGIV